MMVKMGFLKKIIIAGALALTALVLFALPSAPSIKDYWVLEEGVNLENEEVVVTKIIDGDTVIVSGGDHLRLLGIDADERGYPCYDAARQRLEELVLGKTVSLEADKEDKDQYGRKLRYIFLDGANINNQLVAEGLAIARFYPENQKYKIDIVQAENEAINNKIGCKWDGKQSK